MAEDDSEKDKGTDSEEDKDEDGAPKKRPVSPYVLIHRVASIKIYERRSDQCKEKYYGLFINLMKNDVCHPVQLIRCVEHTKFSK